MQQGLLSTAQVRLLAICSGLGVVLIGTVEMVFTTPHFAAFFGSLGLPIPVPSQPIGYVKGFNLGLILAVGIGALLGAATGSGIYYLIKHLAQRPGH